METAAEVPQIDPFNWPMQGRDSLMSLSGINYAQDRVRSGVSKGVQSKRADS